MPASAGGGGGRPTPAYAFAPHLPYYHQIQDDLRRRILAGAVAPGERLPGELDLTRRYGVSRPTVRQALQGLVAEGLVHSVRGRGTFVREPLLVDDAGAFTVFPDAGDVDGAQWERLVPPVRMVPPAHVAAALEMGGADEVFAVRLRHASHGRTLAVRTLYIPSAGVPDLLERLAGRPAATVLEQAGIRPARAVQQFQAVACPDDVRDLLDAADGEPTLVWQGVLYAADGSRIAYVRTVFLGRAYVFAIRQERAHAGANGAGLAAHPTEPDTP